MVTDRKEMQGILGFSEGVTAAASLLVEEDRRVREEGKTRQLKVWQYLQLLLLLSLKTAYYHYVTRRRSVC